MLITMQGTWTIKVKAKNASFPQRFIISGATTGNGIYVATTALPAVTVKGRQWTIAIQNNPGPGFQLSDTRIKYPTKVGGNYQFDIQSNDAGADIDFDDLVLTCTTPATINDFIIYGNTTLYKGRCLFNPCRQNIFVIETWASLLAALKNDTIRKIIEKLYPERIPPIIVDPNPPDPAPYFKPIVIDLENNLVIPQLSMVFNKLETAPAAGAKKKGEEVTPLAMSNFAAPRTITAGNASAANPNLVTFDKISLVSQLDKLRLICTTTPASFVTLSFEEYDRTAAEKAGGTYTGDGNRQLLGDTITDMNGNYIFRFTFSAIDMLVDQIVDRAAGEDAAVVKMPDVIVKVKESQSPYNVLYESAPHYNIANLTRINLCLPASRVPLTSQCFNGNLIGGLGNVLIGGAQNTVPTTGAALERNSYGNHLHTDGRITVGGATAGFGIACASWSSVIDMKGCMYNAKRKAGDPIISYYTIRIRRSTTADWTFVNQAYTHPIFSKRFIPGYTGDLVGPFTHNVTIDGSTVSAPTYKNIQKEIFVDGIDWEYTDLDRYMQLNTNLYDRENGEPNPGTFYVRVDAYDSAYNHIPGATDMIALYIDNKPLNFGLKNVGFTSTIEYVACGLYRLAPAELNTPIALKFRASDSEGFVHSYDLAMSKCPSALAVTLSQPASMSGMIISNGVLKHGDASSNVDATCGGYTGTLHDFGTTDFVTMQMTPNGGWLQGTEQYATFYFSLTAYKRTTNGYNTGLEGPYYNAASFAVERKP